MEHGVRATGLEAGSSKLEAGGCGFSAGRRSRRASGGCSAGRAAPTGRRCTSPGQAQCRPGKSAGHFIFKHPPKHRNQPSRTERGPRTTLPNRKRRRSRRTPSAGAWSGAPRCSTRPGARQHAGGLESLVMEHLAGWAKPNAMGAPQAQDNSARCRSTDQLAGAQVLGAPRICASYCRVRAV
jgi:hypothetical protein